MTAKTPPAPKNPSLFNRENLIGLLSSAPRYEIVFEKRGDGSIRKANCSLDFEGRVPEPKTDKGPAYDSKEYSLIPMLDLDKVAAEIAAGESGGWNVISVGLENILSVTINSQKFTLVDKSATGAGVKIEYVTDDKLVAKIETLEKELKKAKEKAHSLQKADPREMINLKTKATRLSNENSQLKTKLFEANERLENIRSMA